jgi:hypothetical protein
VRGLSAHLFHRFNALRELLHLDDRQVQGADVTVGKVSTEHVRKLVNDDAVLHFRLGEQKLRLRDLDRRLDV